MVRVDSIEVFHHNTRYANYSNEIRKNKSDRNESTDSATSNKKKTILKRNIYLSAIFISIFKISIRVRIAQFQAGNLRPCNMCGGPGVKIFK